MTNMSYITVGLHFVLPKTNTPHLFLKMKSMELDSFQHHLPDVAKMTSFYRSAQPTVGQDKDRE